MITQTDTHVIRNALTGEFASFNMLGEFQGWLACANQTFGQRFHSEAAAEHMLQFAPAHISYVSRLYTGGRR